MFLVWGESRNEKKLGLAADLCSICREVTPHQISRVGMAGHLYFVTIGKGKLIGHLARCQQCGTAKEVEAAQYASLEKTSDGPIELLQSKTFPNLRQVHAHRLEIESKIKRHHTLLTAQERAAFLREPFLLLAPEVEQQFATSRLDRHTGIGCLGTIILSIGILAIALQLPRHKDIATILVATSGIIGSVGALYTLVQLALSPGRYLDKHIMPRLAKSLIPLKPTIEELSTCLGWLKDTGYLIGKKVRVEKLWTQIQAASNSLSLRQQR